MNAADLKGMKRLMEIINLDDNRNCPNCGDELSATVSNSQPTWSDYFDNIVCWWCATHPLETDIRIDR